MATQFEIDCALMSGRAYLTNRSQQNWFPVRSEWTEFFHVPNDTYPTTSGFEAISFQRGSEIVISFAGTDPSDLLGDMAADAALAGGSMSDQLLQAVDYYLAIKAQNPGAAITFTGHSLGGGLAALMGVFFHVQAITFDQAPFAAAAKNRYAHLPDGTALDVDVGTQLRQYLAAKNGLNTAQTQARDQLLGSLDAFLAQRSALGGAIPNAGLITNHNVKGEFLSGVPWNILDRIGRTVADLDPGPNSLSGTQLHAQALLTAFLLNDGFRQAAGAGMPWTFLTCADAGASAPPPRDPCNRPAAGRNRRAAMAGRQGWKAPIVEPQSRRQVRPDGREKAA